MRWNIAGRWSPYRPMRVAIRISSEDVHTFQAIDVRAVIPDTSQALTTIVARPEPGAGDVWSGLLRGGSEWSVGFLP